LYLCMEIVHLCKLVFISPFLWYQNTKIAPKPACRAWCQAAGGCRDTFNLLCHYHGHGCGT
jgi:hypothetical protein